VQRQMEKTSKKLAPRLDYVSTNQLVLKGFESPFSKQLDPANRWVVLSKQIPWDDLVRLYNKHNKQKETGRPPLNPRLVIGAVIIKHFLNLDDRETIAQIRENMYMQYFLGYSSFSKDPPFDPSLFVEIRNRLNLELLSEMNQRIYGFHMEKTQKQPAVRGCEDNKGDGQNKEKNREGDEVNPASQASQQDTADVNAVEEIVDQKAENKGEVIFDATVCPQDIAYPTDLGLLNTAREITEEIIDVLHQHRTDTVKKPRTYRQVARKQYLKVAQNKNPSKKTIRKGIKSQLQFLKRNFGTITKQLDTIGSIPLDKHLYRKYLIIQVVYDQQLGMFEKRTHQVDDRIVSIHQPHVRPIVRGKSRAKTEFGAKIHLSLVDGYSFLDTVSWDAFNEGSQMMAYVEGYYKRFNFYPSKILADKIYCSRENRKKLKEKNIKLAAKPLGRPPKKAVENHVSPGERNPIEGKFGQGKNAYGLNRIKARLKDTSESWISSIILVLNLVKLARVAPPCLSFSAQTRMKLLIVQCKTWIIARLQQINPLKLDFEPV
jgi:transposase, IS5 family